MHQTRYAIPGYAYDLNLIQALQPPNSQTPEYGVILDIDVFTTEPLGVDDELLRNRLAEMRWIKNKAFYTFVTPEALNEFGRQP
jgi:uncharacterized protein (TIGR04255 family)